MANITITETSPVISVNSTSNVVTVTNSTSNIVVSNIAVASVETIRTALSVTDAGGDGSLTYSNTTGVFTYTGSTDADKNNWLATRTTDNLAQGSSNLYFTTTAANSAIAAFTGNLATVNTTGNITHTPTLDGFTLGDPTRVIEFDADNTLHGNISFRKAGQPNSKALVIDFGLGDTADIDMTKSNVKIGGNLDIVGSGFANSFITLNNSSITSNANITTTADVVANKLHGDGSGITGIDELTNAQAQAFIQSNGLNGTANLTTSANVQGSVGIFTKTGTGEFSTRATGNAFVGADLSVGGNLNVTGNINSETVVDLFVEDRNITLQYGSTGTPTANSHLFVDRGSAANTYIVWSETDDKWGFSNDGANVKFLPEDTDDLTEGSTNKYYSNSLMIAGLGAQTTDFQIGDGAANINIGADTGNLWANVGNVRFGGNGIENTGTTFTISNASSNIHGVNNRFEIKSNIDGGGVYVLNTANPGSNVAHLIVGEDFANNSGIGPKQVRTSTVEHKITHIPVNLANSILTSNSNITTTANISGANVIGTYLHGDASNVTGLPQGDITSVVAGAGLTGGGTTGDVTLNAVGGYGITVNADDIELTNSEVQAQANIAIGNNTTDALSEGSTNLYFTNARADARITAYTGSMVNMTGNLTTTANISAGNVLGTFIGDLTGDVTGTATTATTATTSLQSKIINENANADPSQGYMFNLVESFGGANSNASLKTFTALTYNPGNLSTTGVLGVGGDLTASNVTLSTSGKLYSGTDIIFNGADHTLSNIANVTSNANVSASDVIATSYFHGNGSKLSNVVAESIAKTNDDANANIFYPLMTSDGTAAGNAIPITSSAGLKYVPADKFLTVVSGVESALFRSGGNLDLQAGEDKLIHIEKKVNSVETTILDIDTDGYRITSADAHTANIASYTGGVKGMLILASVTAGSPTVSTLPLSLLGVGYPAGFQIAGQSGSTSYLDLTNVAGLTVEQAFAASTTFGGVQNGAGWKLFNTAGGFLANFDRDTHVSSISGNTFTMNKNATVSGTAGFIMFPGVASSTQNIDFLINYTVGTYNFEGLQPYTTNYALPDTLSNVTIDKTSVSDSFSLANVKLGHIADLEVGTNDYVRVPKGLLIGETAEPDPFSSRNLGSSPAGAGIIGLTLEHNGETEYAANNTPQTKFLINNYTANSILGMATTPSWAADFGSGNITVDNQYLSAPAFNFKTLNSRKEETANGEVLANTVIGQLLWNAPSDTVALDNVGTEVGLNSGSDLIHPPAGIKVRMASDQTQTSNTTAMDMYVQSSYRTSYRDGTTDAKGSIPRTFLANKEGNTVLAAKTDGKITLRPVRDYGTTGTDTSFTENRYAHELHEYHEFLGAGFLGTKTGTLVEIQPKSGETGGSANFNYDSKGDATLRLSSHHANNTVKAQWDITNDESESTLIVRDHTNSATKLEFSALRTEFSTSAKLKNYTTAQINALSSPEAGDVVYNTTLAKICFYNGSAWQQVTSAAM